MDHRKDIQGLRALAFLSVFIFQLNGAWLPGGFIGATIFFVILGYLIASVILYQRSKGRSGFYSLYEKPIKRPVPARLNINAGEVFEKGACYKYSMTYLEGGRINYYGPMASADNLNDDLSLFFKKIYKK